MTPAYAVAKFAGDAPRLRTPAAVVVALDELVRQYHHIDLLGIWRQPPFVSDAIGFWRLDHNLWVGPHIRPDYWDHYQRLAAENGHSVMMLVARASSGPFTMAEVEKRSKKRARGRNWVFGLLHSFGYHDCIYCVYPGWAVVFVSSRLLVLPPASRILLSAVSQAAVGAIEGLLKQSHRSTKNKNILTVRELEVLQERAFSGNSEIARKLGLSVETVDTHLKSARRKLGVNDTGIALLEALKRGLIQY